MTINESRERAIGKALPADGCTCRPEEACKHCLREAPGRQTIRPQVAERIDWRARAVANAKAVQALLQGKETLGGTFGEAWIAQANETVNLDLCREPFGAGMLALQKNGTIPKEADSVAP